MATADRAAPEAPHGTSTTVPVDESASETASATAQASPRPAPATKTSIIGPPDSIEPATIHKLYRGVLGEINGYADKCRTWVEFPALQLCWAGCDLPAGPYNRASLLDVTRCECSTFTREGHGDWGPSEWTRVDIHASTPPPAQGPGAMSDGASARPILSIVGGTPALLEFGEAMQQLLRSRELEGHQGLEFIQRRLFQYLWKHHGNSRSEHELYEAQAVLAFNLEPKEGVSYLKSKLNKKSDEEVGVWLAHMSAEKGGLDPTLLGNYFSRRDTLEVFRAFVNRLDFRDKDIVVALRHLFDTFKPEGEGQVVTRILEYFAEGYFTQWKTLVATSAQDGSSSEVAYANPDTVFQVAVSLIMLNTSLHVASKKVGKRSAAMTLVAMTTDQYIHNTRQLVSAEEVPDPVLQKWYEAVKETEIAMEPMPRVAFSKLPVQPDIEGWLIAVLSSTTQYRYWAVLALQRLYLFSDASEVEPGDAIDLKDMVVRSVAEDDLAKANFAADLRTDRGHFKVCQCFAVTVLSLRRAAPRAAPLGLSSSRRAAEASGRGDYRPELYDAVGRAFEVVQPNPGAAASILQKLSKQPRSRLALVAESPDLMEKWVSLIAAGPY